MRVIAPRMRQLLKSSAIRLDRVNVVVAFAVARKGDAVTCRRPSREIIVMGADEQRFDVIRFGVQNKQPFLFLRPKSGIRSVARPAPNSGTRYCRRSW